MSNKFTHKKQTKFDNTKDIKFISKENPLFSNMIKKGLLTESSTHLELTQNCVCFLVDVSIDKKFIKAAMENLFTTEVINVRTLIIHPKKRQHKGKYFYKPILKKVMVRLKHLNNIGEFFDE